jgi:hypothetical protein
MPIIEQAFLDLTQSLDVAAFWAENELCHGFTTAKPRCAASFSPDDHWLFEFLQVPSTVRYYHDKAYRDDLHRQANAVTQQYVGKAFFDEDSWQHSPKRIENLFGCEFAYHEGSTPWLVPVTDDPAEFARILDRAEATDLASWAFPDAFLAEWEERKRAGKPLPALGTGSRGPATIITSVLHPETAIFWMIDHPDLMHRFSDLLAAKMVAFNQLLRVFSGATEPGWWITDDNSALLNRNAVPRVLLPGAGDGAGYAGARQCAALSALRQRDGAPARRPVRARHPRGELRPDGGRRPDPPENARRADLRATAALPVAQRFAGSHRGTHRQRLRQSRGERRAARHHGRLVGRGHGRRADALVYVGGAGGLPV